MNSLSCILFFLLLLGSQTARAASVPISTDELEIYGAAPESLTSVGSRVLFTTTDGLFGEELVSTDGTPEGTFKLIEPETLSSSLTLLATLPRQSLAFYLQKADPSSEALPRLWRTDGTTNGTFELPVPGYVNSGIAFTESGVAVFLCSRIPEDEVSYSPVFLVQSDGTVEGTSVLETLNPVSPANNRGFSFLAVNSTFAIISEWGVGNVYEGNFTMWGVSSDSGSIKAAPFFQNIDYHYRLAYSFCSLESRGAFVFANGTRFSAEPKTVLWRTDGTSSGTVVYADSLPLSASACASLGDGHVLLVGSTSIDLPPASSSSFITRTDGTASGTSWFEIPGRATLLKTSTDEERYLSVEEYPETQRGVFSLFRTDGTKEGTYRLTDNIYESINPIGKLPSYDLDSDNFGSVLLFGDCSSGLWRTDGTVEGTSFVSPLTPTCKSGSAARLGEKYLLFTAESSSLLVITDGTPEGTYELDFDL